MATTQRCFSTSYAAASPACACVPTSRAKSNFYDVGIHLSETPDRQKRHERRSLRRCLSRIARAGRSISARAKSNFYGVGAFAGAVRTASAAISAAAALFVVVMVNLT